MTVGGRTTLRVFDRSALTDTITSPEGRVLRRLVDETGRTLRVEVSGILPANLTYDARGRLSTIVHGSRQVTFGYNTRNELTSIADPLSRVVRYEYDGAGRVVKQILPDLREIAFAYDAAGNLISITPAGRSAHTFRYSGVNLTTDYSPPLLAGAGGTEYIYNVDRELEQIVRPDGTSIGLSYDSGGRLLALTARDASRGYGYDSGGNMASITGADASLSYLYDGSTPTEMGWSGAVSGRVTWSYDGDARLGTESVAGDAVSFTYDDDGLLQSAGTSQLFHGADGILDYSQVGATTETFQIDPQGDLDALLHQDVNPANGAARSLMAIDYTRDAAGWITGIVETVNGVDTAIGYGYDLAGRLDTVTYPDAVVRYTYDANGNRTAREVTGPSSTIVETASYDAQDRLLNYEGTQYTYTANGDLLTRTDPTGTTHYVYDALGNLLSVTLPSGVPIDYLIDGQNRRVGRKVNGIVTHRWLYSDQLRVIAELDASGAVTKRFVYGSRTNIPDYMVTNGVTYRIYSDHLGSPRMVVNLTTGVVVQALRFDEFGYVLTDTNPGFIPFGFAGGLYDVTTGLVRFGARDYDPSTGRWTAKDPIGFGGGDANLYGYAFSDPINFIDPDGLAVVYTGPAPTQVYQDAAQIRAQGHQQFPGEANSSARHAYGAEQMTERYGPDVARGFGALNEVQGFLWHDLWRLRDRIAGRSPWAFQWQDLKDNETGIARGACTYNAQRAAERRTSASRAVVVAASTYAVGRRCAARY